jgi:hypothetical protein
LSKIPTDTEIQTTLLKLAKPGMSTSALMRETKRAHPKAKKKDIIRAAFASIIAIADSDIERARLLQNFALDARGPEDDSKA